MATPPPDPSVLLTQAYRQQQISQGLAVAALVALYYKSKVDIDDPVSVSTWIDLMLPKILAGRDQTGRLAAAYGTVLRRIELPNAPQLSFTPTLADASIEKAVKTSLLVVGPADYMNKAKLIESLDVGPIQRQAMLVNAKNTTADKLVGATMRHVQNGGRQTLADNVTADKLTLGYVRVTSAKPCFFCAMLASRGLVFAEDSFDASDPRFTGDGTAKVHDNCSCSLKPVYTRAGDQSLEAAEKYTDMWKRWGADQKDPLNSFRRGYEHFLKTGELDQAA